MSGRRVTGGDNAAPGVIEPSSLYGKDEVLSRLRWGAHAWRTATRKGLRVLKAGGRAYATGADVIDYLQQINSVDASRA